MADVRIAHSDGRFGTVPEENLARAEKLGWRVETPEDQAQRQKGTVLEAAARGTASGVVGGALAIPKVVTSLGSAALGVEDPLARFSGRQFVEDAAAVGAHLTGGESEVAGRQMREAIQADLQANKLPFLAGEIAGGLVGGGALAAGASRLAARGVAAAGLTGRAATISQLGAAGAAEGAVLGGEAAHEDAWVRNERATASQTLAGMGMGALFGGVLGSGFGALATRGKPSVAALVGDELAEAAPVARSGLEEAAERSRTGWRGKVSSWLDEEAVHAIGGRDKQAIRSLSKNPEERARLGRILNELDITGGRNGGVYGRSLEEMAERVGTLLPKAGEELGSGLQKLSDGIGAIAADEPLKIIDDVIAGMEKGGRGAMTQHQINAINQLKRQIAPWRRSLDTGGFKTTPAVGGRRAVVEARVPGAKRAVTLKEIHELRMGVDDVVNFAKRSPSASDKALMQLRGGLQDWIDGQVDRVGTELGHPELLARYRRSNDEYRALKWASDSLKEKLIADTANNNMPLTGYISSGVGATVGLATGSPLTALALAGASALGRKVLADRGSNTAIAIGRKIIGDVVDAGMAPARYRQTAHAVGDVVAGVQEQADAQFANFLDSPLLPPGPTGSGSRRGGGQPPPSSAAKIRDGGPEAYRDHAQEVVAVATNPVEAMNRVESMVGQELAVASPRLAIAMAAVTTRAATYLATHMPAPPSDPGSAAPHLDDPPPVSQSDLYAYAERVEGVEQPMTLLDDLARGHVSPEKVDAVRTVYPELLDVMRQIVFARLADRTTPLTTTQRLMLDITLDAQGAFDPSLRPASLQVMRGVAQKLAASGPPQRGGAPNVSKMLTPRSQQIAMR